jgi:Ca2+-binding RTX toxin-like protein
MTVDRRYSMLVSQVVAEAYFEGIDLADLNLTNIRLRNGNNRPEFVRNVLENLPGKTRLAEGQAKEWAARFKILDQWSDDPRRRGNLELGDHAYREVDGKQILANSGFSATLMRSIDPSSPDFGSTILSFRSTEFAKPELGGDRGRDGYGADMQLGLYGLAFAQIDAMERYYAWLKSQPGLLGNGKLHVTGYSLGGHLAVAFAELHPEDVESVYIFNSPGRGDLGTAGGLHEILAYYRQVLADPGFAKVVVADSVGVEIRRLAGLEGNRPLEPVSVYDDARGRWAALATKIKFEMAGASFVRLDGTRPPIPAEVAAKVISTFGHADTNDTELVSNMGIHVPGSPVFIEDQPDIQGLGGVLPWTPEWYDKNGDFGTTHSITLIGDSLALMRSLGKLDLAARRGQNDYHLWLRPILSASSNEEGSGFILTQGRAEFDSLENVVDGLGRLLDVSVIPMNPGRRGGDFGDIVSRDAFHANLERIDRAIAALGSERIFELRRLTGLGAGTLVDQARATSELAEGFRYALVHGQTFVVAGFPYNRHNTRGELDLHEPVPRTGDLTEDWLKDRSFFLNSKITANTLNKRVITNIVDDRNWLMIDAPTNYTLEVRRNVLGPGPDPKFIVDMADPRRMVFGSERADYLAGDSKDDRIYGGRGTDVILGGGGDDLLEGGEGLDIYRYGTSRTAGILKFTDGNDTIRDTDGRGVLRYVFDGRDVVATVILDASVRRSATNWESADGRFQYQKVGDDLKITIVGDAGGGFTLKNFRDGDFGIRLAAERSVPQFELTVLGDRLPMDFDPDKPGIQSRTGLDGRFIYGDLPGDPVDDILRGRDPKKHGFPIVYTVPSPDSPGERIEGLEGNDQLYGDAWDANMHGSFMPRNFPGDEAAYEKEAFANRDWILGGPGRDWILAGGGHDLVEGGADGIERGVTGGDSIDGGPGDDVLFGDSRVSLAEAIKGNVSEVASNLRGDAILGGAGADWVIGASGNDALAGGGGDDLVIGGAGNDDIVGDSGHFGTSFDWSVVRTPSRHATTALTFVHFDTRDVSPAGRDTIYGGAGNDWVFSEDGDDVVDGGPGDDVLRGGGGSDVLLGGAGNDGLYGDGDRDTAPDGADYLDGGQGDDILEGGAGEDVLVGGPGNDSLTGGPGRDFYIFERGDGVDIIDDARVSGSLVDGSVIILGAGATRENVKFRVGSLAIDYSAAPDPDGETSPSREDVIHILGFNAENPTATPVLEELRFADGDVMRFDDILARGFDIDGTEGDDGTGTFSTPVLRGTAVVDRIRGFGGRDRLFGFAGDDFLDGGDADDVLNGGDGNDLLWGGAGDDWIDGYEGRDRLEGGDGDDTLAGGHGNDVLFGGGGNDILEGGAGDDIYELGHGSGADVIRDGAGRSRVRLGAGIVQGDLRLSRVPAETGGMHWRFEYGASGDEFIVRSDGSSTVLGGEQQPIDLVIEFADGSSVELEDLLGAVASDPLHLINTTAKGALSVGGRHADQLWGGTGADTLRGMGGNDALGGGAGTDRLFGGDGDDILVGGRGDDYLDGGAGSDVIRLTVGMGFDVVAPGTGEPDVLEFGPEFRSDEVRAWRRGRDLVVRHESTREGVLIQQFFDASGSIAQPGWRARESGADRPLADLLEGWKPDAQPDTPGAWEAVYRANVNAFVDRTARAFGYVRSGDIYTLSDTQTSGGQSNRTIESWKASLSLRSVDVASDGFMAIADAGTTKVGSSRTTATVSRVVEIHPRRVSFPLGGSIDVNAVPLAIPRAGSQTYVGSDGRSHKVSGTWSGEAPNVYKSPVTGASFYYPRIATVVSDSSGGGRGREPYFVTYTDTYVEKIHALTVNLHRVQGTQTNEELHVEFGPIGWQRSERGPWLFSVVDAGGGDDLLGSHFELSSVYIRQDSGDFLYVPGGGSLGDGPGHAPGLLLYGNDGKDLLNASSGDDILIGGRGDDKLVGDVGNDTYVLASDGSRDTIYEAGAGLPGAVRENMVVFPVGVALADLAFEWDVRRFVPRHIWDHAYFVESRHAVLEVTWRGGVPGADAPGGGVDIVMPYPALDAGLGIDFFKFADGTEIPFADILGRLPLQALNPSDADETIVGGDADEQIAANEGDDILDGGAGDDLLVGGGGRDILIGGRGYDFLYGGDFVHSQLGDSAGWVGTLWDGGNVFRGGPGGDLIYAGGGSDVFEVNRGDGQDIIIDLRHESVYGGELRPEGRWPNIYIPPEALKYDVYVLQDEHRAQFVNARDVLRFGPGIRPEHIVVKKAHFDLIVHYDGPTTAVAFENWFYSGENQLASVVFDDGTVWSQQDLLARMDAPFHPDVLNHAPVAGPAPAPLAVRAGQALRWTVPDDLIREPDVADVLWFDLTSADGTAIPGWIRHVRPDLPTGQSHEIVLAPDAEQIGSHQVLLVGTDLRNATARVLVSIDVQPANRAPRLERPIADVTTGPLSPLTHALDLGAFVDDDGDALQFALFAAGGGAAPAWALFDADAGRLRISPSSSNAGRHAFDLRATDSHGASVTSQFSVVVGTEVRGGVGPDALVGTEGDDVLAGGAGNDRLAGGAGDDRYRYSPGEGVDVITDTGGYDGLLLPVLPRYVTVAARPKQLASGAVLQVRLVGSSGAEMANQGVDVPLSAMPSATGAFPVPLEYLQFGGGVPVPIEQFIIRERVVALTDDAAAYSGTSDDETILASSATASIAGQGGHDVIRGADRSLTASGGPGQDYLEGSPHADHLRGDSAEDVLSGRDGDDRLEGGFSGDMLLGGAGADVLLGGMGMNFLAGGRGDDTIHGFGVADIVAFNRGDGADRLVSEGGFLGSVSLGGGIALRDISFSRAGNDLVVDTGEHDRLTFVDWYRAPASRRTSRSTSRLQILRPEGAPIVAASPLEDSRAEWFDLRGLAGSFDRALAQTPTLDRWSLADAAAAFHQGGSDQRAYGGDLAWWFGGLGAPDGVLSLAHARGSLEPQGFVAPRQLKALAGEGPWVLS